MSLADGGDPRHQKTCLTRTSSAYVRSSFRERIHDIPALILWGMHDPAFRQEELDRLQTVFSHKRTACFHDAGHFPQEERSERAISLVEEFLAA